MTLNNKKMIIISSILGVTVILIVLLMLLGANLIIVKIPSISSLLGEYGLVKKSEKELEVKHGVEHKGALYIDISTIEVFKPISISKLLKEIPNLRYSTRVTKIPIENLDIIIQLINND